MKFMIHTDDQAKAVNFIDSSIVPIIGTKISFVDDNTYIVAVIELLTDTDHNVIGGRLLCTTKGK